MTETASSPESAAATPATQPPQPPAVRALPTEDEIAAWSAGAEAGSLGALFEGLKVAKLDVFVTQIRKQEILPQHWQVISKLEAPPDEEFEQLAEVGRLRVRYKDQELSRARLHNLRIAWRELRGRRPALWTVPDLLAALRRIVDQGLEVDFYHLLTATRDVWLDLSQPMGKEQVEILWNCLIVIRRGTKK